VPQSRQRFLVVLVSPWQFGQAQLARSAGRPAVP
jgi:hypothetical protein